ncbi:MAG TPA: aminotransferase class III-fold pyridoxal phosphate-dependent enzyme [Candidatus Dormibacteraeota bacterium]
MSVLDEWAAANPRSLALHERARRVIPGGITHDVRYAEPFPMAITAASGSHKTDADGHDLVCYAMGHGALLLGHNPAPVVEALGRAAQGFLHAGSSHELEAEWAERICALVPSVDAVHFTSSGTEATMLALQVARGFTGRDRVVRIEGHFHGWHDTAAIGAEAPFDARVPGVPDVLRQVVAVVPPDAGAIEAALATGDVAAVILEPTGASFGAVPLSCDLLAAIRELTTAAGALLVFDEVISGFRWSPGGLQQVAGVLPDLTTMAKIVAGGMPGGALGGAAEIMEVLAVRPGGGVKVKHPGTHNAHPLSAAAGIAMLDAVADGAVQSRADEMAGWLRRELEAVLERTGVPGFVHGESSTFRVAVGTPRPDGEPTDWWRTIGTDALKHGTAPVVHHALQASMLLEGVHLFQGRGFLSSAHTEADIDRTATAFERSLLRLRSEGVV